MTKLSVLLINREFGLNKQIHPVCGKSGKLYGQATGSGAHNALIFQMPHEEYEAAKFDLCGNKKTGQQWVPSFEMPAQEVAAAPAKENGAEPVKQERGAAIKRLNTLRRQAKEQGFSTKGTLAELEARLAI